MMRMPVAARNAAGGAPPRRIFVCSYRGHASFAGGISILLQMQAGYAR